MINKQSESNVINEVVREKATEKDVMKELRKFVKWRGKQFFFSILYFTSIVIVYNRRHKRA